MGLQTSETYIVARVFKRGTQSSRVCVVKACV